jgi:hypothetical protein
MSELRTQAARWRRASDKLAATLVDSLKEVALRIENQLVTEGHPMTEKVFEGAALYRTDYALHADPRFP